jgi:hypothetical protein
MEKLLQLLNIVPAIVAAIKAVEAALPDSPTAGKAKLAAVISIVTSIDDTLAQNIPQFTTVINAIVALFNSTVVFKKAATPTTPSTT